MYPRLPSATVSDSMAAGYPTASSAAPPSTLSGVFDHDDRRRYTGGTLQRARPDEPRRMSVTMDGTTPSPPSAKGDEEDGDRTPPAKRPSSKGQDISANLIDPALHSSGSSSPEADATTLRTAQAATEVAERADSQWVSLVRALEGLRGWINYRIDHEDFDSEDAQAKEDASMSGTPTAEERVQQLQQHEQQQQPEPQESIRDDVSMGGLESDAEPEPERREKESTAEPPKQSSGTDEGDNAVMYPTLRGLDDDGDSKMPS